MRESLPVDSTRTSTAKLTHQQGVPYLDLESFFGLIQSYNFRQLTYPEDTLLIVSALTSKFQDGFYCGLPVIYLDIALLRQLGGDLARRVPSNSTSTSRLPSWSWAGWNGKIPLNEDYLASYVRHKKSMKPNRSFPHSMEWAGVVFLNEPTSNLILTKEI